MSYSSFACYFKLVASSVGNKRKLEEKCDGLKKDIEGLEGQLKKSDEEKKAKDNQIKQLNDEMARQDEQLLKTQNAKKQVCNRVKEVIVISEKVGSRTILILDTSFHN